MNEEKIGKCLRQGEHTSFQRRRPMLLQRMFLLFVHVCGEFICHLIMMGFIFLMNSLGKSLS